MSRTPYPDLLRRRVLRLWSEGLSQNEIAEQTGMTRAAVSAFVFKLRRRGYSLPHRPKGLTSRLSLKQRDKQFAENALLLYWHESRRDSPLAQSVRNRVVVSGTGGGAVVGPSSRVWTVPTSAEVRAAWSSGDYGSPGHSAIQASAD